MDNRDEQCTCWVRHAISPEYRQQITHNLEYFRSIGDQMGTLISTMQLSPCPSVQNTEV